MVSPVSRSPSPIPNADIPDTNTASHQMTGTPSVCVTEHRIHNLPISTRPPLSYAVLQPYRSTPQTCSEYVRSVGEKISLFLRNNWKNILLYILAWALILACHHTVAVTLTIWLSIGLGAGVVFGIFTANLSNKKNKDERTTSIWNLINHGLQQLDANGTRQILLATITASISALIYAIPEVIGFSIGASIGNQISVLTIHGLRLGGQDAKELDQDSPIYTQVLHIQKMLNHYQLIKNQMIIQQQILAIAQQQQSSQLTDALQTIQLHMHTPLPYVFDLPGSGYCEHLHFSDPNLVIQAVDQRLLSLSQTLAYLKQDPNRIIEE